MEPLDVESWEQEEIFFDGDSFFESLIQSISQATSNIEIQIYIWANDEIGNQVKEALKKASQKGVRVRILVDGVGSPYWHYQLGAELEEFGISGKIFHPWPWSFSAFRYELWRVLTLFRILNRRNHSKIFLIDDTTAYAGSMNITNSHLRRYSGDEAWRDTGVWVKGSAVSMFRKAFDWTWKQAWEPLDRKKAPVFFRPDKFRILFSRIASINSTRQTKRQGYKLLAKKMRQAVNRIEITNAYLVPSHSIVKALRTAARRGVPVKIIVPLKSDIIFMKWAASAFIGGLLKSGIDVYQYKPRFLHAKTLRIDNWAIVGSSNLNHRSLFHDFEVDIVLTQSKSIETLSAQFQTDLSESHRVTLEEWKARGLLRRIAERIFFYLRYWI